MNKLKTLDLVPVCMALTAAFCTIQVRAQSTPGPGNKTQIVIPQSPLNANAPLTGSEVNQSRPSQDVQALDGTGIISMSSIRKPQLLVGGAVSGGYDSNPLNLGDAKSSMLYSVSPYLSMQSSTNRTQFLIQYHPTITRYSSYSGKTMHLATAKMIGSISPRLSWAVDVAGSHGDDSLRLLGPAQTGSGSGTFLPNAGVVTNIDSGADLHYDASPRDVLGLHFSNSYSSFPALKRTGSVATASFSYNHALKQSLSLQIYEQSSRYYGDLKCTAIGAGVGIRWQPRESTLISLKGGPQIDTPGCNSQQGFSYGASIARKLPRRSQLFVTADRQPVVSYLGSGLWQDDVSAGYERSFQSSNVLSFDVGFVHSSTLANASSYHGTFFDASYVRQLHRNVSLGWGYRTFTGASGPIDIRRNILQFSLTFTPHPRPVSQ